MIRNEIAWSLLFLVGIGLMLMAWLAGLAEIADTASQPDPILEYAECDVCEGTGKRVASVPGSGIEEVLPCIYCGGKGERSL